MTGPQPSAGASAASRGAVEGRRGRTGAGWLRTDRPYRTGGHRDLGRWVAHDVRIRHDGAERLRQSEVGVVELNCHTPSTCPFPPGPCTDPTVCTAEPGSTFEERLKIPAGLAVTRVPADTRADAEPIDRLR
ncbi:hypothetical protein ACIOKD_32635 [Streptomyces sp. NPDC087844]|uniref:hypothetical protein n=1 Tax=Streptomyces sp. NPDC087844 TaxID=3365805 RepID=UPI0037F9F130